MTSNNMMTSLANYSPHPVGMQQHPGMAQGHPMGVPHNPGQPGQPGPGMPQQMHMGVSGPGPQVSQGGAMMGGMPPGAGGPSAHALQHLNPGQQQQMFQQQQQAMAFANNPQLQQMQQQHIIAHQRHQAAARQALLAQQYSGVPIGMQNGMNQMTQAQYQAMRGGPMARPVNLPQHLQQQQQQAEHSLQQQQAAQAQQQHHQQMMMAQQLAMQQQAQAQQASANNPGQPTQMNQQQAQNMQQSQAAMMGQQAHQQQQAHAAGTAQQNQVQSQAQAQPQQSQPNAQAQAQQAQQAQQAPQNQQGMPQQQQVAAAMMQQQQRQGDILKKGQCLMKLVQFGDHLSAFGVSSKPLSSYMANGAQRSVAQGSKQKDDLTYWLNFVDRFFSSKGVLRHSIWDEAQQSNKQYEITFPALPRYFHTHFESGIRNIQMIMERGSERELPNNGHYIESQKSSFVYWFDNGSQLVAMGTLKAHFDADQKIELLEFATTSHDEYIPRSQVLNAARPWHEWQKEWKSMNSPPDGKQSPEMNKKKGKAKSPNQAPPDLDLPESRVKPNMGITPTVFRFLEFAEVIVQMNPLFSYSHQHPSLTPYSALDQYVATVAAGSVNNQGAQQQNPSGPRTPGMGNFPIGTSPAQAHLNLPGGSNSPHMGGSPAQGAGMQHQQSQHGTSSSGPSANTSPNASNKRRRPSGVKEEDTQINGVQKTAVKPSPRIGGKRQKGNPA